MANVQVAVINEYPPLAAAEVAAAVAALQKQVSRSLLVGIAPFVGLAIAREWSPTELGLGAVMVIFSARAILAHRRGAPPAP
jgi:hypothetical protein